MTTSMPHWCRYCFQLDGIYLKEDVKDTLLTDILCCAEAQVCSVLFAGMLQSFVIAKWSLHSLHIRANPDMQTKHLIALEFAAFRRSAYKMCY